MLAAVWAVSDRGGRVCVQSFHCLSIGILTGKRSGRFDGVAAEGFRVAVAGHCGNAMANSRGGRAGSL
jgi:hypothetical protein